MILSPYIEWYLTAAVFVLGAIIGSFLNVVIYRFHTGKSINGDSHCLSCLEPLRWFELFPLISYLSLKGRCRTCRSYIPPRYFVVELLTAISFLAVYCLSLPLVESFFIAILLALFIVIAVYDVYHLIIPNELVVLVSLIALAWLGHDVYQEFSISALYAPVLSASGAFAFYGGLWKMSKGHWIGLGDAKLAIPLGLLAGFPAVFSMIVLSFWVGALVSLVLIGCQRLLERGQITLQFFGTPITMKSEIPFAPFLIIGFILAFVYQVDVLALVSYVL